MVEYILWKIEFENYTLKFGTSCTLKLEDGSWMNSWIRSKKRNYWNWGLQGWIRNMVQRVMHGYVYTYCCGLRSLLTYIRIRTAAGCGCWIAARRATRTAVTEATTATSGRTDERGVREIFDWFVSQSKRAALPCGVRDASLIATCYLMGLPHLIFLLS